MSTFGKLYLYDGVIKSNSITEEFVISSIDIRGLETNRSEDDFDITVTNGIFDSGPASVLPDPFFASLFDANWFTYDFYGFTNTGSGESFWYNNEITTGMLYNSRYGIGYFYFLVINTDDVIEPVPASKYSETIPSNENTRYWDYLTTFWDYLK